MRRLLAGQNGVVGMVRGAMTKVRNDPNWASIGLAQEALVGVKHNSTLLRAAHARIAGGLVRRQVVHDHVDGGAVRSSSPDGLERGEGVVAALAAPEDTPQLVNSEAAAAVEVADPVRAGIGRRQPGRARLGRPGAAVTRPDRERPELFERETAVREPLVTSSIRSSLASLSGSVDSFQVRVRWERHPVLAQQLTQPSTTDPYRPVRVLG
jgi:hypothetical protein